MFLLLLTIAILIISYLFHWWYARHSQRQLLQWMGNELGLPFFGIALEIRKHTEFINVFEKYTRKHNGLCWVNILTKTNILATDYKFVEFILSSNQVLDKGELYHFLDNWLGTGLLTSPGTKWKEMRKVLTPAFHFSILEQFLPIFESNLEILVKQLKEASKEEFVDVCPYITKYTLDNICETAMGVKINAQINNQSEYVQAVKEMCKLAVERTQSLFGASNLTYRLSKNFYKERKVAKILHKYTDNVINSRREELEKEKSENVNFAVKNKRKMAFLDLLLKTLLDGKPLPQKTIIDEVNTFMFAGHDTTASAISSVTYCLANHPEVQVEAYEEQKRIFEHDMTRCATYTDLQNMKYLDRVIKETLRLYPPAPFINRLCDKDIQYEEGKIIPAGVEILIFIHGIHRNPDIFEDPDRFNPDRFKNVTNLPPYCNIPFSAGPRNCIGQKFSLLEIKLTVSKLLRIYEITPAGPAYEPVFTSEIVFHSTNGIHVGLKEREIL